jgi:hypothetical protein
MTELNNVPVEKVPHVVEIFILSGKTNITLERQSDGNWTIRGE